MHGKPVGENRVILTNDEAQTSMQNAKVRGGERLEIERLIEGVSREMDDAVNSAVLGNSHSHLREMQRLRDRICNVLATVRRRARNQ